MSLVLPRISTDRLLLRCVRPEDAGDVATLMTPGISQWLAGWPSTVSRQYATERIETALSSIERADGLHYLVTRRRGNVTMGWIRVERVPDHPRRGELGFWLGESFQRLGYMKEAVPPVCAAAFAVLGLDAIEAGAQLENSPSLQLLRKLGMNAIGERNVFASARSRYELCAFYEMSGPRVP